MTADPLNELVERFGLLRLVLWATAIITLFLIPSPGTPAVYSGWPLVTTVLIPVLAPMLFLVLLLDALMARVFLADASGTARRNLKYAMLINVLAAVVLLVRWLPYYAAIRV